MEIVHDSDEKPIDTNDFKDAFLASLYDQFEFLSSQLEEKDLLIRTLIIRDKVIRDNESYTRGNPSLKCNGGNGVYASSQISSDHDGNDSDDSVDCNSTYSNSDRYFNGEYVDEIEDGEEDFKTLYQQFEDQIGGSAE